MREPDPQALLRKVEIFRKFDDIQLREVSALLREQRFAKEEAIFYQDDPGDCLYIIVSGFVRIYLVSQNGDEVTLRVYGSGAAFGEFAVLDGKPRAAGAIALTDVVTFVIYRVPFLQLLQRHFDLTQNVIEGLVERLRYTTTFSRNLAFLSAIGRVAHTLAQLAAQASSEAGPVRLAITQDELARATGATREWINKALRTLAEDPNPLVKTERGSIIVLDRERLQVWADSRERRGYEKEVRRWSTATSHSRTPKL